MKRFVWTFAALTMTAVVVAPLAADDSKGNRRADQQNASAENAATKKTEGDKTDEPQATRESKAARRAQNRTAQLNALFDKKDTDKNGSLSLKEYTTVDWHHAHGKSERGQGGNTERDAKFKEMEARIKEQLTKRFSAQDADGNKKISREEFLAPVKKSERPKISPEAAKGKAGSKAKEKKAAGSTAQENAVANNAEKSQPTGQSKAEKRAKNRARYLNAQFEKQDVDKNGSLSLKEYTTLVGHHAHGISERGQGGNTERDAKFKEMEARIKEQLTKRFSDQDADGNKKISREEFLAPVQKSERPKILPEEAKGKAGSKAKEKKAAESTTHQEQG